MPFSSLPHQQHDRGLYERNGFGKIATEVENGREERFSAEEVRERFALTSRTGWWLAGNVLLRSCPMESLGPTQGPS